MVTEVVLLVIEVDDELKEEIKAQDDENRLQFAIFQAVRGLTAIDDEDAEKIIENVRAAVTDES